MAKGRVFERAHISWPYPLAGVIDPTCIDHQFCSPLPSLPSSTPTPNLYPPHCVSLKHTIFGTFVTQGSRGSLRVSVEGDSPTSEQNSKPCSPKQRLKSAVATDRILNEPEQNGGSDATEGGGEGGSAPAEDDLAP